MKHLTAAQSKKSMKLIEKFNKKILKIFKKILDKPPPLWYNISTKIERGTQNETQH
jgi:hypothetical protein